MRKVFLLAVILLVILAFGFSFSAAAATVESVHIIDEYDNDLTPEYAWPTLCPGESLTLHVDIYPPEYRDLQPVWTCEDENRNPYPLTVNDDGTVTIACTGTEQEYLTLWATVDGTSGSIRIYFREEHAEETSEPVSFPDPVFEQEVYRIWILNEKDEDVSLLFPDLFVGESMTLNDDGSVTVTCLNAELTHVSITVQADHAVALAYITLAESTGDKLIISDETLLKPENDTRDAVYFARIENISDEPMTTRWWKLIGYQDSEVVFEEGYIESVPDHIILNPGEYAYVEEYIYDSRLEEASITSFELKEMAGYYEGTAYNILPSEAALLTDEDGTVFIRFILSNNTEEILYPSYLIGALYDKSDRLIYVTTERLKEDLGIYPGSTVSMNAYLEDSITEYYQENGIVPARADSILYVQLGEENVA